MPIASINNINLSFDEYGTGEPVVLISGTNSKGRVWTPHQVTALTAAGYRVITVDNRGIPPTDACPQGITIGDMVADTAGLIDSLGISPCRILGYSMGAVVVQELLLARPGLITDAVLMATRGRTDALHAARSAADLELFDSGVALPPRYAASVQVTQYLSRRTQNSEREVKDWLDVFEMSASGPIINRAQHGVDVIDNRLEAYRNITARCLVISFQDDLLVPAYLGREVAGYIPDCRYEELAECGHLGYLENPAAVNSLIVDFFRGSR
jgi:pimeloyl-ACP methyl ester carboxylesterase